MCRACYFNVALIEAKKALKELPIDEAIQLIRKRAYDAGKTSGRYYEHRRALAAWKRLHGEHLIKQGLHNKLQYRLVHES